MSVVDYNKKKGLLGKVMDLAKLSIDSTLVNMEKSLYVASNTFDAVLAIQGKIASEVTGKPVTLESVMDTNSNIWCPSGVFTPSEEETSSSTSSNEGDKPLTKSDALALIEAMQKKNQENLVLLLKEMAKEEE